MQRTKKKTWKKIDKYPWRKKIYFIFYAGSKWPPLNRCPPAHTSNVHTQKCAHTHRKAFVPLCVVMQRPHCSTFSLPPLHGSSLPFISPSFENHFHRNFSFFFFCQLFIIATSQLATNFPSSNCRKGNGNEHRGQLLGIAIKFQSEQKKKKKSLV